MKSSQSSWIEVNSNSHFPIQNIPFGIFQHSDTGPRVASIIGDTIIDLYELENLGYLEGTNVDPETLKSRYLNDFIALGKAVTNAVRQKIMDVFDASNPQLEDNLEHRIKVLIPCNDVEMLMPVNVGDYTDFYSSEQHAYNVGCMFRDPDNALMPNWKHIPVGYHGRASSIVVSGTDIHRPKGQQRPDNSQPPVFGPCRLLVFELEMAFVVGRENMLGDSISTDEAEDHIFGMCIFNDWSARDIQKWEYVPLGPFLAKNFASSISPWIVTMEAIEDFKTPGPTQDPKVLPYLEYDGDKNYDVNLEVIIQTPGGDQKTVSQSNYKYMYWNMCQQLAHHTVNGCNVQVGDMMASGTISGPDKSEYGSMLEISWQGKNPIDMPDGTQRKFLLDHDTVIMKAYGEKDGVRIGFGEVRTKILPSK